MEIQNGVLEDIGEAAVDDPSGRIVHVKVNVNPRITTTDTQSLSQTLQQLQLQFQAQIQWQEQVLKVLEEIGQNLRNKF